MDRLKSDYPWTLSPLISLAPMRLIALSALATEVSRAGGLGFIGAGSSITSPSLPHLLSSARAQVASSPHLASVPDVLPIGVGFLLWAGEEFLQGVLPLLEEYVPAAVWLFAPHEVREFETWTREVRRVTGHKSKVWIQIGTVAEAVEVTRSCQPDVLVVQGQDAGGHGLETAAGLVALLPEVDDEVTRLCEAEGLTKPVLVAGGGIMDGRGVVAAMALGAGGVTMGTRFLAAPEAEVPTGYRDAVMRAKDGGVTTKRTRLYDRLRGTRDWPARYGGRGVVNCSWEDAERGMSEEENQRLYDEALEKGDEGWGENARLATYAGAGVGLVKGIKSAARITEEVREDARRILKTVGNIPS